jgi:hypothetical protein
MLQQTSLTKYADLYQVLAIYLFIFSSAFYLLRTVFPFASLSWSCAFALAVLPQCFPSAFASPSHCHRIAITLPLHCYHIAIALPSYCYHIAITFAPLPIPLDLSSSLSHHVQQHPQALNNCFHVPSCKPFYFRYPIPSLSSSFLSPVFAARGAVGGSGLAELLRGIDGQDVAEPV